MSMRTCCLSKPTLSHSPKSVKTFSRSDKSKSIKKITSSSPSHPPPHTHTKTNPLTKHKHTALNEDDLNKKLHILSNIYQCSDTDEMKFLLKNWPNEEITLLLQSSDLLEIKKDHYFIGNICNNLIHGYGLVLYNNKRFYEGYFYNNLKHGPGFEKLDFGIYIGNYINNKPQGKGIFIWNNNNIYQGDFVGGIKHGQGQFITETNTYIGSWKHNQPEGHGIIINNDSKYQGDVIKGIKHGEGKETFKNGDVYTGHFVNGKFQGTGMYHWIKSGSIYKGIFKNGLRHGKGIWTNPAGNKFEGMYENNRKNGNGIFEWCSGNVYRGDYFDDLRHGLGEMYWANGSWYRGYWKYGHQEGEGEMYEAGHSPHKGVFKSDALVYEDMNNMSTKLKIDTSKRASIPIKYKTESMPLSKTPKETDKFLIKLRTLTSKASSNKPPEITLFHNNNNSNKHRRNNRVTSETSNPAKHHHTEQHSNSCSKRICSVIKTYLNSPTCNHQKSESVSGRRFQSVSVRKADSERYNGLRKSEKML